jgi:hypothetical protein
MQEREWLCASEEPGRGQGVRRMRGVVQVDLGQSRGLPQGDVVAQHGHGLGEATGRVGQPRQPVGHVAGHALRALLAHAAARRRVGRAGDQRVRQLTQEERVSAGRLVTGLAHAVGGRRLDRSHEPGRRFLAQRRDVEQDAGGRGLTAHRVDDVV